MSASDDSPFALEDLLPHRCDMLLIDEVLAVDSETAVTASVVKRHWPLVDDRGVSSLILVEVAAQAAGVCNGWERVRTQGTDSEKKGYLVGIKRAEFFVDSIPVGQRIVARVRNTYNFENLREVSSQITWRDTVVATITLQLFQVKHGNDTTT